MEISSQNKKNILLITRLIYSYDASFLFQVSQFSQKNQSGRKALPETIIIFPALLLSYVFNEINKTLDNLSTKIYILVLIRNVLMWRAMSKHNVCFGGNGKTK